MEPDVARTGGHHRSLMMETHPMEFTLPYPKEFPPTPGFTLVAALRRAGWRQWLNGEHRFQAFRAEHDRIEPRDLAALELRRAIAHYHDAERHLAEANALDARAARNKKEYRKTGQEWDVWTNRACAVFEAARERLIEDLLIWHGQAKDAQGFPTCSYELQGNEYIAHWNEFGEERELVVRNAKYYDSAEDLLNDGDGER